MSCVVLHHVPEVTPAEVITTASPWRPAKYLKQSLRSKLISRTSFIRLGFAAQNGLGKYHYLGPIHRLAVFESIGDSRDGFSFFNKQERQANRIEKPGKIETIGNMMGPRIADHATQGGENENRNVVAVIDFCDR